MRSCGVSGKYPDENFAREIMQLFSIGLWQLNDDGPPQVRAPHEGKGLVGGKRRDRWRVFGARVGWAEPFVSMCI
jgi:hypothetical protein